MKKESIRRIIALALCLMVLVAYTPLSDWAGIMNGVAKAASQGSPFNINGGSTSYATLKDAYNASKDGDIIYMTADGNIGSQFSCGKDITVAGCGHTLYDNVDGGYSIWVGSALKFKDMNIKCSGSKNGSFGQLLHMGDGIGPVIFDNVDFLYYNSTKTAIVYLRYNSYLYFNGCDDDYSNAKLYKEGGSGNKVYNSAEDKSCSGGSCEGDDVIVASVGIVGYEKVKDAISACSEGGTVVIRSDLTYDYTITKKIVLELNGWKLNSNLVCDADVTIKDRTGRGAIAGTVINNSGKTLNVQSGSIGEGIGNAGTLNITGGTITKSSDDIITNSGTLNISGGTVAKGDKRGIKSNSGTVTITGGSLTRVDICGGTANVSGGTITTVGNYGALYMANATVNVTGGTIVGPADSTHTITVESAGTLNMSGGTATCPVDAMVLRNGGTANISGATTFSGGISANSGSTLKIDGGTFTTSSSNQPIHSTGGTITINGGTIIGQNGTKQAINATSGTITITGGTLTRVDMAGSGTVNVSGGTLKGSSNGAALYGASGATLNVTGGTFSVGSGISVVGSVLNISGGKVLLPNGQAFHVLSGGKINISGTTVVRGYIRNEATVSISGGYFDTKPDAACIAEGKAVIYSTAGGDSTKYRVGEPTVRIDTDGYDNIADAIAAATENSVLYLSKDITDAASIASGKTVTIDLNGHEMKGEITNNGTLTMKDSTTTGKVSAQIKNNKNATLTIQGGTYQNDKKVSINNSGTATVTGGTISRFDNYDGSKATISGGTFTNGGSEESAVYAEKTAVVDITGGVVENIVRANLGGTFNISGGTFKGLVDIKATAGNDKSKATITGGSFKEEVKCSDSCKILMSGGFYVKKPDSSFLEEGSWIYDNTGDYAYRVAEGKVCRINNTYYGTLKKAVNAANYKETIVLLEDISANVSINSTLTIDLNGHKLTSASGYPISVESGEFSVCDTPKTGKIEKAPGGTYSIVVISGQCNIINGVYDRVYCYGADAELYIADGTFAEGVAKKEGNVVISGGWFKDQVPDSFVAEGLFATGDLSIMPTAPAGAPYSVGYQVMLDMNVEGVETYWTIIGPKSGFYAEKPNDPYREDYDFKGWYSDQGCTVEFDFATNVITKNTVVYAKWKKQDPWKDNCDNPNCKHQVAVGNRHYNTFKDATDNASSGSTIKLIKDCVTSVKIVSEQTFTVDLNGHTLSQADPACAVISNYGTLTIMDSTDNHFGKITAPTEDKVVSTIENFNTLTINSGNVVSSNSEAPTISNLGGLLYLNGGTVTSVNAYAVFNGTCYYDSSKKTYHGSMAMTGGSIVASAYCVWTVGEGKIVITGGDLTSSNSHVIRNGYKSGNNVYSGNVFVGGGTLTADTANGSAQVIYNYSGTVTVQPNDKDSTYPRLKGAPAFTASSETHTTIIKGGWYSDAVPVDNYTTLQSVSGKTLYPTGMTAAGPIGCPYTVGYKVTTDENYSGGKTYFYYAPVTTGLLTGLYTPRKSDQVFTGWSKSKTATKGDFDVTDPITDNITLYAIWSSGSQSGVTGTKYAGDKYILTIKATNKGIIEIDDLGNDKFRIRITPNEGYQVGAFFLDGNYQASGYSSYTIQMRSDSTVNVEFISVYMTAEEYREYVKRKEDGTEGYSTEDYTHTSTSGGTTRYSPSKPDPHSDSGRSDYTGGTGDTGEDSYEDPNGKKKNDSKKITDKDGNEYDAGELYKKIILSLDKDEEIGGVDDNGWYFIGEDIEQYFPDESTLEEIVFNREEMTIEEQRMKAAEIVAMFNLKAKSGYAISPLGKKAIKIIFYDEKYKMDVLDGAQVFRSLKKNKGYGKKPKFTTKSLRYYNTAIKKGKKYYYKVRAYIKVDGVKYFTKWSTKACRKAKY